MTEEYPTDRVKQALLAASHKRTEAAMHCAGVLCYLTGAGKEPFDWDAFRAAGCRPHGFAEHRFDYYVMRSELRTMAEYIAHRKELEPWDL